MWQGDIMTFWDVLSLLAGLSFFLFGMSTMSNGLEKAAGSKLEVILKKMTSNLLVSIFVGATITAVIQSSSATTVMLVGLVNSGLMNFATPSALSLVPISVPQSPLGCCHFRVLKAIPL
jgi:Na+/phosphate symporter